MNALRDAFFDYICSLTKELDANIRLINKSEYALKGASLFNEKEFLKKKDAKYHPFFQNFIRTQLFANFLECCLFDDLPEITYYHEIKKQKRTKKRSYLIGAYPPDKIHLYECPPPNIQGIPTGSKFIIRNVYIRYLPHADKSLIWRAKIHRKF